jgi:predicted acetyltransferase
MAAIEYRKLEDDAEALALGAIEGWSFGFPPPDAQRWFTTAGVDNVRVAVRGGRIVGGLLLAPMGQWFGGKSVATAGVAGVAVAPEERGSGVAIELMRAALGELRAEGTPLSTLYPATRTLYRAAGYEIAGTRYSVSIRPGDIGVRDRTLPVRELGLADADAVAAVYSEVARHADGWLDRGPYVWQRVRAPRGDAARGFGVEVDGKLEGYLYALEKPAPGMRFELRLTDLQATTARAARRLLGFATDHQTIGETVTWQGGPADLFVAQLPERGYTITLTEHWMIRIVSVEHALTTRGWLDGVRGSLDLEVRDALFADNAGGFVLEVADGRATVRRGGRGALRLDVRGLAALYSGFMTPWALRQAGWLEGDDAELVRAAALFAGSGSSMPDFF